MYGPQGSGGSAPRPVRKVTVPEIRARKGGSPIAMVTAYDYTMARLLDEGGADVLLVGDSLGMVVQGHPTTLPVTLAPIAEDSGPRLITQAELLANAADVDAAVAALRERVPPDCELRIEVAPDLPPVRADEGAVVSALINLLDNAIKYTPDQKRVVVRAARMAGGVAFEVQDNGIGIAPREHRRIFRRFYRVDQRLGAEIA